MARNIIFESLTTDIIKSESTWQGYLSINDNKNINNDLVNAIINNEDILVSVVYEDNSEDELLITNKEVDTESALKSFNYEFDGGYIRTDSITNVAFLMSSELAPVKFVFYIEAQDTPVMLKSGGLRSGNDSNDISKIKLSNTTYNIKDTTARADILTKQDTLVSGTNIKSINNQSLLGSGNLIIESGVSDVTVGGTSIVSSQGVAELNSNIKTISLSSGKTGGIPSTYTEIREAYDYYAQNQDSTLIFIDGNLVTSAYDNEGDNIIIFNTGGVMNYYTLSVYFCDYANTSTAHLTYAYMHVQDVLQSGTNIKTINNTSLLGSGNLTVGGDTNIIETVKVNNTPLTPDANKAVNIDLSGYATTSSLSNKQDTLVSGTNIKTINNQSLLGSGNITIETDYTAGDGIDITSDEISNTAGMYLGDDTTPGTNLIDADLLGGNSANSFQLKLTAGNNINIDSSNVISATNTTYVAGTGITISGANNTITAERNSTNTYTKTEVDNLLLQKITDTTSTSATIANMVTNRLYVYTQPLTSLTITVIEDGPTGIIFKSGSTPTNVTLPATVLTPDNYEIKANKTYEFNIMNNLLVFGEW